MVPLTRPGASSYFNERLPPKTILLKLTRQWGNFSGILHKICNEKNMVQKYHQPTGNNYN